jgi:hypothetical protein
MDENPYRAPRERGAGIAERSRPPICGGDLPAVTWAVFLADATAAILCALAYVLWRRHI